ncbi:hypothetical protein RHMOL_Rhmol12G0170800 [Rhododendron molle]|uniref:Uncharacterized protein n=1 Tax=Rhododendron molle TaxID=49168 RepID=A0ACC0LJI5_RHOML|nr:hypothetical protein RHMOL_Rhmol12G0170800 [Rhododendron molle]
MVHSLLAVFSEEELVSCCCEARWRNFASLGVSKALVWPVGMFGVHLYLVGNWISHQDGGITVFIEGGHGQEIMNATPPDLTPHSNEDDGVVLLPSSSQHLWWRNPVALGLTVGDINYAKTNEATPKTIMRTMGVKGLTLYHLKSHLQRENFPSARIASLSPSYLAFPSLLVCRWTGCLNSKAQFKGAQMSTGATVAIKMHATDSRQGEKEFQSEVMLLGRLHHRNLVNLVSYAICISIQFSY